MLIQINSEAHNIPSDLSEITLNQFLSYYDRFGRELDAALNAILEQEYEDEFLRELDLSDHLDKEALAWLSHFSGYDFNTLKGEDAVPVLTAYRAIKALLVESENEQTQLPWVVEWQDTQWEVKSFRVTPESSFTFLELIASKEVVRQIRRIEKSKWDALPYLCAIFFRKKGEAFQESFIAEGSERLQLMGELPLSHALKVAFFLTISVSIWNTASRSSKAVAPPIHTSESIMSSGVGSTS